MAKTAAQRVRAAEAAHRARGEREMRVWVPDDAEAIRQVRELAAALRAAPPGRDRGGGLMSEEAPEDRPHEWRTMTKEEAHPALAGRVCRRCGATVLDHDPYAWPTVLAGPCPGQGEPAEAGR